MFTKRTIKKRSDITSVDTASEALAVSIGEKAVVDMSFMAKLTGIQEDQLAEELQGVIFRLPDLQSEDKPTYVTADEYLSGNVREKLRTAKLAARLYHIFAYGSLHNISRFISAVANAKDCKVSDDQRNCYARKYQAEIESLRLLFESDYKTAFTSEEIDQSIKRDIERIKKSKDSFRTYVEIHGQYTNKKNDEGKPDMLLCNRFMYAAADAGIVWAFPLIGDFHFEGLLTDLNFIKAAECYEKGFSQLTPPQKLRLASIYLNNLCGSSNKKEEGAYFGRIRTLIPATSGQRNGIIRTAFR